MADCQCHKRSCSDCYKAYQKAYRQKNYEVLKQKDKTRYLSRKQDKDFILKEQKRGREYWQRLRHEAVMAYGGYKCTCCGETEPMFLSIDHINNDGAEHRRKMGCGRKASQYASSRTLKWLKDNGYPEGFQILCMNCNTGKQRNNGVCPHKAKALDKYRVNSVETRPAGKAEGNTEPSLVQ